MTRLHSQHYYHNLKNLSEKQMYAHIDLIGAKIREDRYVTESEKELYFDILEYQDMQLQRRKDKLLARLELIAA
jgi:hypothetical protein